MRTHLSIGSNIGNREENIYKAINLIEERIGEIILTSQLYETEPWGFQSEDKFINIALIVDTLKQPLELLSSIKTIEKEMGRVKLKTNEYESRIIDIDIIFYGSLILSTSELTIPHPLMHKRDFVLTPMNEIDPEFTHPLMGKKINDIYLDKNCC